MKTIITAAIIATATLTATVSNAGTYSYCTSFSGLIEVVAEARDVGVAASTTYQHGINSGMPSDAVAQMIQTVYVDGALLSPKVLRDVSFQVCMGEKA